jgi:hypothetical protein
MFSTLIENVQSFDSLPDHTLVEAFVATFAENWIPNTTGTGTELPAVLAKSIFVWASRFASPSGNSAGEMQLMPPRPHVVAEIWIFSFHRWCVARSRRSFTTTL